MVGVPCPIDCRTEIAIPAGTIIPEEAAGKIVLSDRFTDSTLAYQGYGRGIDLPVIEELTAIATLGLKPEMTILFDIESSDGLARLHPGGHDRLEREALEFHLKVRQGYLELSKKEPERWRVLDASKPLSVVQTEFRKLFVDKLNGKYDLAGLV